MQSGAGDSHQNKHPQFHETIRDETHGCDSAKVLGTKKQFAVYAARKTGESKIKIAGLPFRALQFSPRPCIQGRGVGGEGSCRRSLCPLTPNPSPPEYRGARGYSAPLAPVLRG